jgi:hypothetical protein
MSSHALRVPSEEAAARHSAVVDHLLDEIEEAVAGKLWLLAVTGSLLVPDVAAALRDQSGQTSRSRYKAWWKDSGLGIAYDGYLSADDAYRYRCSLTHQASGLHPKADSGRVLFMPPSPVTVHKISMGKIGPRQTNAVALDITAFAADVVGVARGWLRANKSDPIVQRNLEQSVRLHPKGLEPFIIGVPVVG